MLAAPGDEKAGNDGDMRKGSHQSPGWARPHMVAGRFSTEPGPASNDGCSPYCRSTAYLLPLARKRALGGVVGGAPGANQFARVGVDEAVELRSQLAGLVGRTHVDHAGGCDAARDR
jgi:hypothetical protein